MIDLYLRAADEAALIAALPQFRATDENGNAVWATASHTYALDVIGTIYTPVVLDQDGNIESGGDPLPGFHANLRLIDEDLLEQIPAEIIVSPDPSSPSRVWANGH